MNALPPRLALAAREVHLWAIALPADAVPSGCAFEALLSPSELSRAGRLRAEADRRRFVAAHGWLRILLGRYAGLAPASLRLPAQALGKPWLAQDPGLHFNCSRSGAMLLVGVTRLAPIGVDIEPVRSLPGRQGIVDSCFAQAERDCMARTPGANQDAAFFRIWTGKEAVVKALGTGLSTALDGFAVGNGTGAVETGVDGLPGPWTLKRWCPQPGYQAALALQARSVRLCLRRLDAAQAVNPARQADPASPASPA